MAVFVVAACSAGSSPSSTPPATSTLADTTAPPTTIAATTVPPATDPPTTVPAGTTTAPTTTAAATTTTTADVSMAGMVVVIDPGHNGKNAEHPDEINRLVDIGNGTKACNTTGTQADDGYPEAAFNWALALATRDALEELGATVVMTRRDNDGWGPCIDQRAAIGNEAGADAVISIHADGGPATGRGFHVIHPAPIPGLTDDIAGESRALAEALLLAFPGSGMPVADYVGSDGLSERSDLGGLNLSDVPAVFLEVGNMKNASDIALLEDEGFRSKAAGAITAALVDFLTG